MLSYQVKYQKIGSNGNPDAWRIKFEIMSFTAIPKVKILSFQLFGHVKSCVQILHVTVQNKITLPKHLHTPPSVLYLLGFFNFTHAYLHLHFVAI